MKLLIHWITELIFPTRCLECQTYGAALCRACLADIPRRTSQECIVCKHPTPGGEPCTQCKARTMIDRLLIAGNADHPVLWRAIHALKYSYVRTLAGPLAEYAISALAPHPAASVLLQANPLVIPVPLHSGRLSERGFNQSALLAHHISARIGMHHRTDILERIRATESQVKTSSRGERLENMENAFGVIRPDLVADRDIVLIDDVCTTGATLDACASALKHAGARTVSAIVLARG